MKLYLSILLFFIFNTSFACSCVGIVSTEKALDAAHVVITGKVLSKESFTKKDGKFPKHYPNKVKYKILVTKIHKGEVKSDIVTIVTGPALGGDCGYFFQIGLSYTIYADYSPVFIDGKKVNELLETNICTRTNKFDQQEFDKIEKYCQSKGYN